MIVRACAFFHCAALAGRTIEVYIYDAMSDAKKKRSFHSLKLLANARAPCLSVDVKSTYGRRKRKPTAVSHGAGNSSLL